MSGLQVASRAVIFGRVQGVGFRYACLREAQHTRGSANLTGWVRNTSKGNVEVFVQGDSHTVEELLEWCRKGPRGARVDRVEISVAELDPFITDFDRR